MDWHYVEDGKSVGPVAEQEFTRLVEAGKVRPDTLVWHEGMPGWIPCRDAVPSAAPAGVAPAPTSGVAAAPPAQVVCQECHRTFSREETIQYGAAYVCAACKPAFVQRLREGAETPSMVNYGGFWIRFGAKMIDVLLFIIISVPFIIFMVVSMMKRGPSQPSFAQLSLQIGLNVALSFVSVAYTTFFHGKYGATLGKMACGLKVVTPEGGKITYGRALGRGLAELVSGWICDIGYIIAAFDSQKRSLHDHIAGTRVIRVR